MITFRARACSALATIVLAIHAAPASATDILFIGNSFIYSPFISYGGVGVTDLNNTGYSGIAGLFKTFTNEAGLNYNVSVELVGGQSLQYHYTNKRTQIGSNDWDVVVMHDYSTLSSSQPGNPSSLYTYSKLLEQYIHGTNPTYTNANANPNAEVFLMQTWARADQVYATTTSPWYNTSLEAMNTTLHNAYYTAAAQNANINGVIPVGDAWLLAVTSGVADRNPYDGIDPGKVDLWGSDHYHQSAFGSYLEALVLFGQITGLDPRSLGAGETAATTLGLSSALALTAQDLAYQQLQISAVPEPQSYAMLMSGVGVVAFLARRRSRRQQAA
jgi:hypothetical protein